MNWHLVPARRFPDFADRWQALHARGPASCLLAADFVAPLVEQFAAEGTLLAYCERGADTVAMALLAPGGRGAWATFQPSQAPLGLWLQEPGASTQQLCAALLRALPGFPLLLALTQQDPLFAPRPPDGPLVRTLDYIDTARVTLAGGFEDYWGARGKNLRANLRKQRARLQREGVETRLGIVRERAGMARAVEDFGRLESAGWKAARGTAVHAENAQGRYYRAMLENFAARDAASVVRYHVGGRLAAMDLCVEDRDAIVVLKTSYDEQMTPGLSPTLLMREEALRRLFEERRFARLEFYGRVMDWHLRFTDEVRTLYHINYYRWPGLQRLHAMLDARARGRVAQDSGSAVNTGSDHVS